MSFEGSLAPRVLVHRLPHAADLPLPETATASSAGYDLRAAVRDTVVLEPRDYAKVPTGIALEIPAGWEGQVRPRSGLAIDHGVTVLNAPGTIDADYRGEVGVILINHGTEAFEIHRGARIAQVIIAPAALVTWQEAEELSDSSRGAGGFGSSGRL